MKRERDYIWIFVLFLAVIGMLPSNVVASEAEFFLIDAFPLEIRAGENTVLNLTIKNLGTEQALRVGASLDPDDTSPIDPLGPIKTQIEKAEGGTPSSFFGAVNQAEEISLTFKITAKHNASRGTYNVPLKLEWGSTVGTNNQTIYIGMTVLEASFASLSIRTIEPDVMMPGRQITMTFTLLNDGQETIRDIVLSWSSAGDVIKPLGSTDKVYITSLTRGQELEIPINIIVNQNATPGIHTLNIGLSYYDSNGNQKTSSFSSALNILRNPDQEIDVKLSPVYLNPGEKSEVVFEISNQGTLTIRDIAVVWTAKDNAVLPVDSGNRITLSSLDTKESVRVPVQVVAGFAYGVYPLTIEISYYDQLDEMHKNTMNIGAVIGGGTDFEVSLQQSSGTTTSFSIGNIGVNPATAVVVRVPPQDAYAVVGPFELFLGNLDPGDFSVAGFQIVPKGQMQRGKNLQVEVSYTDTAGERRTVSKGISISPSEQGARGFQSQAGEFESRPGRPGMTGDTSSQNYIVLGVGGLVAIIVAAFLWKFLRRKKE